MWAESKLLHCLPTNTCVRYILLFSTITQQKPFLSFALELIYASSLYSKTGTYLECFLGVGECYLFPVYPGPKYKHFGRPNFFRLSFLPHGIKYNSNWLKKNCVCFLLFIPNRSQMLNIAHMSTVSPHQPNTINNNQADHSSIRIHEITDLIHWKLDLAYTQ